MSKKVNLDVKVNYSIDNVLWKVPAIEIQPAALLTKLVTVLYYWAWLCACRKM